MSDSGPEGVDLAVSMIGLRESRKGILRIHSLGYRGREGEMIRIWSLIAAFDDLPQVECVL